MKRFSFLFTNEREREKKKEISIVIIFTKDALLPSERIGIDVSFFFPRALLICWPFVMKKKIYIIHAQFVPILLFKKYSRRIFVLHIIGRYSIAKESARKIKFFFFFSSSSTKVHTDAQLHSLIPALDQKRVILRRGLDCLLTIIFFLSYVPRCSERERERKTMRRISNFNFAQAQRFVKEYFLGRIEDQDVYLTMLMFALR